MYMELIEKYQEYERNGRLQEDLKAEICEKALKMRSMLRKAHKKLRKGSSNVNRQSLYDE